MSSTKAFKERMTQLAVARDGEHMLGALLYIANNQPLSSFGVTNGAAATTFSTGSSAAIASADGRPVKVAGSTAFPALTGLSVANGSKVMIAFTVDAAGNLGVQWGTVATSVAAVTWPDIPRRQALVGFCLLENGSGSTFTGGTTALDTAGITLTYGNSAGPLLPVSYI